MNPRSRDALTAAALFLAGLALAVGWRMGHGLWGALGTDAVLWGMTAEDLRVGATPLVPPGYPAVLAALGTLGVPAITAGWWVSSAATALLGPATLLAARRAGASPTAAALAGLGALAVPDVFAWSQQLQPDAMAALAAVILALLLVRVDRPGDALAAGIFAGALPLLREHGVALAALTAAAVALRGRRGLVPLAALLLTWWLAPLLLGLSPGRHPLDVPWGDRAGGALAALFTDDPAALGFLRELPAPRRAEYVDLVQSGDRLGQVGWHAARSLRAAWDLWLVLGIGGALALTSRRATAVRLALPLLAAVPALLIWSQRRHVALLLPVALATAAAASAGRRRSLLILLPLLAAAPGWSTDWRDLGPRQRSERHRAESLAAVGDWLCTHTPPGSLLGGIYQDVGLYCPLPRHDPDGSPADWNTFLVADGPPRLPPGSADRWQIVARPAAGFAIHRLDPDREPRPCAGAHPAPDTPHLAVDRAHATLVGCEPGPDAPALAPRVPAQ